MQALIEEENWTYNKKIKIRKKFLTFTTLKKVLELLIILSPLGLIGPQYLIIQGFQFHSEIPLTIDSKRADKMKDIVL